MNDELKALAERVQALTGPCRETDRMILAARGSHVLEKRDRDRKPWWYPLPGVGGFRLDDHGVGYDGVPRFTASLDAAMTLVPEGCDWLARNDSRAGGFANVKHASHPLGQRHNHVYAATPALALTAAALLARASIEHGTLEAVA